MKHNYSINYKNIRLEPLSKDSIEKLREWRNDKDNCTYLSRIGWISPSAQLSWYEKYLKNTNEIIFQIVEVDEIKTVVGSLSLYDFTENGASFGKILIGDKRAHGKKVGLNATIAAITIAFMFLEKEIVKLTVFEDNIPARKVYDKAGFVTVSEEILEEGKELTMQINREEFLSMENSYPTIDAVRLLEFQDCSDSRGKMSVIEGNATIPFEIKRVFYSYQTDKGVVRGNHANKKTQFVIIPLAGECKIKVIDAFNQEKVILLNQPNKGIFIPEMIWKEMYDYSADCVLLLLASEHYDSQEYIKSKNEFIVKGEIK